LIVGTVVLAQIFLDRTVSVRQSTRSFVRTKALRLRVGSRGTGFGDAPSFGELVGNLITIAVTVFGFAVLLSRFSFASDRSVDMVAS